MVESIWSISQEPEFWQVWDLCKNAVNIKFLYRTNSEKINDSISSKLKKPCIWLIFGAKKIFLENPALSCTTSYGFTAPCQNLEKVNDTIQTKKTPGQMDGQTLYYRTLLATAEGPKREIEKELGKIFGNIQSAEKVPCSGRLRLKFPCPVENCEFRTVDTAKHLKYKH